jgi:large subunit ribosomal protein L6
MSRIGKALITIPKGVDISVSPENVVTVKGPKGSLTQLVDKSIKVNKEESKVTLERTSEDKQVKSIHGLYRSLINNMVIGVSKGYTVQQELVGVGYRAKVVGQQLELTLGYSHPIILELPVEVKLKAEQEKGKNPTITMECHDKQLIGLVASKIRSFRTPEPYKGKGIKFVGEVLRRKAGKSAGK